MPATATAFLCLLVLAALIAPIEQARVHQLTSLDENMAFGLPFASLAAGYALGAWRQWLGWQRHWGKVVATTAAVVTVIMMLIVGRVEGVQFRGPGSVSAQTIAFAINHNYTNRTLVLVDGSPRTDQYNVPKVPPSSWISSSDMGVQTVADICNGYVSVVVLRFTGHSYDNPADQAIAVLLHRMFSKKATTGGGGHTTEVWALKHRTPSCNAG